MKQFRNADCGMRNGRTAVFVLALALTVMGVLPAAAAEKPASVYRIGYVGGGVSGSAPDKAFVQELRALGWIEGQNIAIEYRWAEGDFTRIDDLADRSCVGPGAMAAERVAQ